MAGVSAPGTAHTPHEHLHGNHAEQYAHQAFHRDQAAVLGGDLQRNFLGCGMRCARKLDDTTLAFRMGKRLAVRHQILDLLSAEVAAPRRRQWRAADRGASLRDHTP